MTKKSILAVSLILAAILVAPPGGWSQSDYGQHQTRLVRMAEVMGGLHYLRGICDKEDNQVWRGNMMRLLDLEQPPQDVRERMVSRFNSYFDREQKSFSTCNRKATREIKKLAGEGQQLTSELSRNLR